MNKLNPNLATLNSALFSVSSLVGSDITPRALSLIAEFRKLNIEPSLGTYYLLLQTMARDKGSNINQG